ncbi:hypothetical protein [Novipirellula artificiosorum]|uniref:Uncharacterized protein n=1 Tax=Novipirellula artificiosorum TaxID=2528016 RepID=A0A5C6D9G2_9BACT|nr:hypothetical protein [Novipirellula artificiosorum]TWU33388.1 hypothetical protein Poly41_51420 [Novipirellula artificiosorum]
MHCVLLADLAALVSQHADAISLGDDQEMADSVTHYWTSTRSRLELWHQVIARYRRAESVGDSITMSQWWNLHMTVLEEILVSETLCRVIAAVGKALDEKNGRDDVAPITETVFQSHLEVRARVHHLMLFGRGSTVRNAVRLNRLRKGVERWTDALLGRMIPRCSTAARYTIDTNRANAYAEECSGWEPLPERETACWLFNIAMHDMLMRRTTNRPALPRSNQRVADSVLRMFPRVGFDSLGTMKSHWLRQLERGTKTSEHQPSKPILETKHHPIDATRVSGESKPSSQRWYI